MNRYQAATPRAPMLIAAVAMSALTLGLSVLPAIVGAGDPDARLAAPAGVNAPMAAGTGNGTPIVVHGVREQRTAFQPTGHHLRARDAAG